MKTLVHVPSDTMYYCFEQQIANAVASLKGPLFTTDSIGLFEMYLNGIPPFESQHYNCSTCRRFIEKYGGLVTIDKMGKKRTALWEDDFPPFFQKSVDTIHEAVLRSRVNGVFLSNERVWGIPKTGQWTHLCGVPMLPRVDTKLLTVEQQMAAKLEDRGILLRGIGDFKLEAVRQAVRILEADAVDRSEKTLGVAKWFHDILTRREMTKDRELRDNMVWLAVAEAPPGFCNVRSTMIGCLLEDIVAGMDFETIKDRWNAKMHPLQYQRPTATISTGQIAAANKMIEKLQAEGSLQRRFAKIEDCLPFWIPSKIVPIAEPIGGVFDHLLPKAKAPVSIELPSVTMTWEKFYREQLPKALKIEVLVPSRKASFYGLVTAVNPSAPPILQWDYEDCRNPISWYFVHNGSYASSWNLQSGWVNVNALMRRPCHWHRPEQQKHQGEAIYAILEGCRPDTPQYGGAFFPECLKAEFHSIRAAMEAYSLQAQVLDHESATGCGIALQKGTPFNVTIRVTDCNNERSSFLLDRWE